MRMKNSLLALSFLFLSTSLTTLSVQAQNQCAALFEIPRTRSALEDFLKTAGIPAVLMPTVNGEIPVVLMNARTGPLMKDFMSESIGTLVAHQPNWKNDHGLLRLDDVIADMDVPGMRQRGELHSTGISWVSAQGYLQRGGSYKRLEVAYALTPAEVRTARLYQRMRRAAILRVRFAFGNFTQNAQRANFLSAGGENCFAFCSASSLSSQINEVHSRFQATGLGSFDEVIARPDVGAWLEKVNEKLLAVNPDSAQELSPALPAAVGAPKSILSSPAFQALDEAHKSEALNWLVGGNLSLAYQKLVDELGFSATGSGFTGMNNRRATAVLIYDTQTPAAEFVKNSYESKGIFSIWTHANARPLSE